MLSPLPILNSLKIQVLIQSLLCFLQNEAKIGIIGKLLLLDYPLSCLLKDLLFWGVVDRCPIHILVEFLLVKEICEQGRVHSDLVDIALMESEILLIELDLDEASPLF